MMTDGRQRRTPAATQLPSILSEIAPRARLDEGSKRKIARHVAFASPLRGCPMIGAVDRRRRDQEMKTDGEAPGIVSCFAFAFRPTSVGVPR
jgi:hypothetical protein